MHACRLSYFTYRPPLSKSPFCKCLMAPSTVCCCCLLTLAILPSCLWKIISLSAIASRLCRLFSIHACCSDGPRAMGVWSFWYACSFHHGNSMLTCEHTCHDVWEAREMPLCCSMYALAILPAVPIFEECLPASSRALPHNLGVHMAAGGGRYCLLMALFLPCSLSLPLYTL